MQTPPTLRHWLARGVFAPCAAFIAAAFPLPVHAQSGSAIPPEADSYVRSESYGSQNFGTETVLWVKNDAGAFSRRTYIRFNVSSLTSPVSSAVLRLPAAQLGPAAASTNLQVHSVANDTWIESGSGSITWNNMPAVSTLVGSLSLSGGIASIDVTSVVNSRAAGDTKVTLRVASATFGTDNYITFGSRENATATLRPSLVINGGPPPVPADAFAWISRSGAPQYKPFYNDYVGPHAVLQNNTIFTAHQDGSGRPIVGSYSLATSTWQPFVRASTFGLGADDHGNPSINIDANGYIHLFFGAHGTALQYVRSNTPYTITTWTSRTPPVWAATYPQSVYLSNGSMALFYRNHGHVDPWAEKVSTDNGATWGAQKNIVEFKRGTADTYAGTYNTYYRGATGNTVHCFMIYKDDNPSESPHQGLDEAVYRYHLYYMKRDASGQWTAANGTVIPAASLPVNKPYADANLRALNTGTEMVYVRKLVVGDNDQPYAYVTQGVVDWKKSPEVVVVPWQHKYVTFSGGAWQVSTGTPPASWPAAIRERLIIPDPAVVGGTGLNPWYVFYRQMVDAGVPKSFVWMRNVSGAYATRAGGPAPAP